MSSAEVLSSSATAGTGNPMLANEYATLRENVARIMQRYFANLDGKGEMPRNLYDLVMEEIEAPLFEAVMRYTRQNQSKAAIVMGLARGTLRTKLKKYGLLDGKDDGFDDQ